MTDPQPGREAEYQDWYANTHIVEMVGAPSVLSARLHTVTDARTPTKWRHCALYGLMGDPAAAMAQVFEQGKAGETRADDRGRSARAGCWRSRRRWPSVRATSRPIPTIICSSS